MQHRLQGGKHVFLGDERHLQVELVKLARRPIGTAILVAETGRDLKVAVEAGHHQQLLELLRRLRQRVKLARVLARRHEEVARAFRAGRRQDRRLKLHESLLDHAPTDRGNDLRPQFNLPLHLRPAQVEEPIAQPHLFTGIFVGVHLQRHHLGGRFDRQLVDIDLDPTGLQVGVHRVFGPRLHVAGDRHHRFHTQAIRRFQQWTVRIDDELGDPVAIAQIQEQKPAMAAFPVDPAGQADGLTSVGVPKGPAGMRAISVHSVAFRSEDRPGAGRRGERSAGHGTCQPLTSGFRRIPAGTQLCQVGSQ